MAVPRYKTIDINTPFLEEAIASSPYSKKSLAKKIGIHPSNLYSNMNKGKMNPYVVKKLSMVLDVPATKISPDIKVNRIANGRSTTGRLGTDWLYLQRALDRRNSSMRALSLELGKSPAYLSICKREGGLYLETIKQISKILDIDPHHLVTSYDKYLLRAEIRKMIGDSPYK